MAVNTENIKVIQAPTHDRRAKWEPGTDYLNLLYLNLL
jgi:hypothetical protein